ncbi:MAG: T9SS type A sorting domain-containing protein [Bacteroidales bacterium]|nr:T9SS type A sorting domain-containing protein [Bacteroidales bacterium]MBO7572715.1 T9SS type A sorting domain-containing protein [Bacteroidales bacterium]
MKRLYSTFVFILLALMAMSQLSPKEILDSRGELYFRFRVEPQRLNEFSNIISIDAYRDGYCYAYANRQEFASFRSFGIDCEPVREYYERKSDLLMAGSLSDMFNWNRYPTYGIYCEMMQYFAETYPEICKLDTIGTTLSGYKLLSVKISDNVNDDETEPEFFLGGQMHGDELIGGMVCLRLIDKLLRDYGTDSEVTNLVNNMEIFINPLSNPEGTYIGGADNVDYSMRYTRNGDGFDHIIDMNRNFPDAIAGEHPDEKDYAFETEAFMRYADEHKFVLSANLHSGAEVVNYPFDTDPALPADDAWWRFVATEYVELAREVCHDQSYMTSDYQNGYINGYAWYTITGSRQDYMNYFKRCREVTLELSIDKKLSNDLLPSYTSRNIPPMLAYMKRATFGLRGFVTDSVTGEPLKAMVFIDGHDYFNSQVYSFLPTGEYYRFLKAGHYNVSFYADGYIHKTFSVDITDNAVESLDVQLVEGYDPEFVEASGINGVSVFPNPVSDRLYIAGGEMRFAALEIYDMTGRLVMSEDNPMMSVDVSSLEAGQYVVRLSTEDGKIIKSKFLKVQ